MTNALLFFAGLAALVGGAELLVRGAGKLAVSLGISPLVVGLTVAAFGTSSPELAVSVQSAWEGRTDLAVGNVVGSNVFNVLFILGLSAVLAPLVVSRQVIRQEVPIMVMASLLLGVLAGDGTLGRAEAGAMFLLLAAYTAFLVVQSRRELAGAVRAEVEAGIGAGSAWDRHWSVQVALVAAGLVLLVAGSGWLVTAAIAFARALGVSELVIGLTIVAAGTSAPEVAASVMATIRGEREIAVGNVIGSCTFNILGVLGLSGLVAPQALAVAPSLVTFDLPVMMAVALACLPVFFTGNTIARWEGFVFLAYYAAYAAFLVLAAREHDALPAFSGTMMLFVLPITALTLAILAWRARFGAAPGKAA
ncbi:MAG: calcium/sodium antiporter [Betaproteobacteria bacterium]|nr:calcium/sodium antiporter [Betaproteobacteria bacterium]